MKKPLLLILLLLISGALGLASTATATVDLHKVGSLELGKDVRDVAFTLDGKWAYALTKDGHVRIYSMTGQLEDTLQVGSQFDRIAATPYGDRIYLTQRATGNVQLLAVEFIHKFDTSGSPSRGPADAPVEIVAFDDFQ